MLWPVYTASWHHTQRFRGHDYFLLLTCYFMAVLWPFFHCTLLPSRSCLFPSHPAPWMPYEFAVSRERWLVGVILVVLPVSRPRRVKDLSHCDCLRPVQTTQFTMSDSPRYESHTRHVCHRDVVLHSWGLCVSSQVVGEDGQEVSIMAAAAEEVLCVMLAVYCSENRK